MSLKLTKNFRKARELLAQRLQEEGFQSVEVKLAGIVEEKKAQTSNLAGIKRIIAVSSCKGGVGKSTVAVNLAFALSKFHGLKVGIFDADIYGPSLPVLLNLGKDTQVQTAEDGKSLLPFVYEGVQAMSFGWVSQNKRAVIRGPMASSITAQLLLNTVWGELDCLIVDFPPGTGDIQITLGQEARLSAAVIVSTPQSLSYVDVIKGIEMFDDLKVPSVAILENMSQHTCTRCGCTEELFGPGKAAQMKTQFGIKNSFSLPLLKLIASNSDRGTPFVLVLPEEHSVVQLFKRVSKSIIEEVDRLAAEAASITFHYDTVSGFVFFHTQGKKYRVKAKVLRDACRCALCVDEFTGKELTKSKIEHVVPTSLVRKGNYAVAVTWSDGHRSSIYPFERIFNELAKEQEPRNGSSDEKPSA